MSRGRPAGVRRRERVVDRGRDVGRGHVDPARVGGRGEDLRPSRRHDVRDGVDDRRLFRVAITEECVGACPNRAVDLLGWRLRQFEAMVDAIAAEELPVLATA